MKTKQWAKWVVVMAAGTPGCLAETFPADLGTQVGEQNELSVESSEDVDYTNEDAMEVDGDDEQVNRGDTPSGAEVDVDGDSFSICIGPWCLRIQC